MNCNVSAISYHFGSKEELYRSCLKEEGQSLIALVQSILIAPENQADFKAKLKLYLSQFFDHAMLNRDSILIVSKDANSKSAMETVHTIFSKIPESITAFLQEAQAKEIIRKEIDIQSLCHMITSPIFMQVLFADQTRLYKQKDLAVAQFRHQFVDQQVEILTNGIF